MIRNTEPKITMKDIAQKLGVSVVTVSKAFNNKEGVSEELRAQIKKTAEEMGYRYNATAKALRESHCFNIGVIVASRYMDETENSFYLKMYQNIIKHLTDYEYSGILEIVTQEMEDGNELPRIISNSKIDGLIVLGQMKAEYLLFIKKTGIHTVYLDFYNKTIDVDAVITDNIYGEYLLTNYLVGKGHKKIAFIGNIYTTASILDRYLGYYRSLLANRLEVHPEYLIPDRTDQGKFIEIKLPKDMPTAFVCNCDTVAYALIQKLKDRGYRVPEDISVVGFDNYSFGEYSTPKLTTVEVDVDAMTMLAVDTLQKQIAGQGEKPSRKVISGTLIIRDSVAEVK